MNLQEKDGYQLEEGYRLEKIIDRLTYPSNIEFSEAGDIHVSEAGFTYPYIYARSRILQLTESG
jgi:hypothetical protein